MPIVPAVRSDLSVCELEPIRFSGAVQPHGVLLVLDSGTNRIVAASESSQALLGRPTAALLGQSIQAVFRGSECAAMSSAVQTGPQPPVILELDGQHFSAVASVNASGQLLVDIEGQLPGPAALQRLTYRHRREFDALSRLKQVPEITRAASAAVRALTGLDQVMIYRFDEAWNGEVVAEARDDKVEPYLGLHFPASDIPRQARELFEICKVRLIADVHYVPSALLAVGDAGAIDLGQSSLRSVSPIHIEYLRNMGARATLVGALMVEGRLWGLVSCQHKNAPWYAGAVERDLFGGLCKDIARLIEAAQVREQLELEHTLAQRRRTLVQAIRSLEFKALMRPENNADLLGVVKADGFALVVDGKVQTTGATPSVNRVQQLYRLHRQREPDTTLSASAQLLRDFGLEDLGDGVAGALFVTVLRQPAVAMIWFRREQRFSLRWGGDPNHPHHTDDSGRISPRKSFDAFLQEVRGQALPWSAQELHSASELISLVEIEALREREAFALTVLNSLPEPISVLDAQGVIVGVNSAWKRFAQDNDAADLAESSLGVSYRDICAAAAGRPGGEEAAAAWAGIEAVLSRERDRFELVYPCDSPQERRWFRMVVNRMIQPAEGVLVAHENITQRKLAELELARQAAKNAALLHNASDGVTIMNRQGYLLEASVSFCDMLGYPMREAIGLHVTQWDCGFDTDAELMAAVEQQFEARKRALFQSRHRRKDGSVYDVEISGLPRTPVVQLFAGRHGASEGKCEAAGESAHAQRGRGHRQDRQLAGQVRKQPSRGSMVRFCQPAEDAVRRRPAAFAGHAGPL